MAKNNYSKGRKCKKCGVPIINASKTGLCIEHWCPREIKGSHYNLGRVCRECGLPIHNKNISGFCSQHINRGSDNNIVVAKEYLDNEILTGVSPQYVAGFFDGEGSIGIYSTRTPRRKGVTFGLKVALAQNKTPVSEMIMDCVLGAFGGSIYKGRSDALYRWQAAAFVASAFLECILPFLILKKEQAVVAINWQKTRTKALNESQIDFNKGVVETMKLLKRGTIRQIKKSNPELCGVIDVLCYGKENV